MRKLKKLARDPIAFLLDSSMLGGPRARPREDTVQGRSELRFERHFGVERCREHPFYNFGAGEWRHPYFRNIDIVDPNYPDNRPDIIFDAFDLEPLAVDDDSAELFYISHVNEHLHDKFNRHLLAEIFRSLRPGGTLRIVYPDVDAAYAAYLAEDRDFFLYDWKRGPESAEQRKDQPVAQLLLDFFASRAQVGSPKDGNRKYSADEFEGMLRELGLEGACEAVAGEMLHKPQRRRPNTHVNWWNHGKFERVLSDIGFVAIERSAYLKSRIPPLRDPAYFDRVFPHMSGYVEAKKPAGE